MVDVTRQCNYCNIDYVCERWEKRKFCSHECATKFNAIIKKKQLKILQDTIDDGSVKISSIEDDDRTCAVCLKQFKNKRGRATHVFRSHPNVSMKRYYEEGHPRYCKMCGELIKFKGDKYHQMIFCGQKCFGKALEGKSPANKGVYKIASDLLLNDLKRLHKKYEGFVTQKLVIESGEYCFQTYHKRFGSFNKACELANIPFIPKRVVCAKEKYVGSLLDIQIDSREQFPYKFDNFIVKKMDVGDYKIALVDTGTVIERKALGDLKSTLSFGGGHARFCREFDRARAKGLYVVVLIDCKFSIFMKSRPFGKMSNKALFHNLKMIESKYGDVCQFLFTGSRHKSANLVYLLCCFPGEYLSSLNLQDIYDSGKIMDYLK